MSFADNRVPAPVLRHHGRGFNEQLSVVAPDSASKWKAGTNHNEMDKAAAIIRPVSIPASTTSCGSVHVVKEN